MKRFALLLLTLLLLLAIAPFAAREAAAQPVVTPAPTLTPDQWLALWYQAADALRQCGEYPYVALQKGDQGYEVRALQTRLSALGYYTKALADNYGAGTYAAMRQFEKTNRLSVDGMASVHDQQLLFSSLARANDGTAGSSGGSDAAATPSPTPASSGSGTGKWGALIDLDPDVLDSLLATATPTPTLFIPKVTLPKYIYVGP
jgi:peptidoglycan hydrolase-like protein with peptidoglycan-binding domain